MTKSSCCTPARGTAGKNNCGHTEVSTGTRPHIDSVLIPGGTGLVGTATAQIDGDGESPLRRAKVKPFRMSVTTVTNAQFKAFVSETGYVTEAEKFGWSFVFWSQVPESLAETQAVANAQWWRRVDGAIWSAPNGPGSEGDCHPDHPVVQVSWNDACAFARWVGGRLPTEAEWEHAARGGQGDVKYPWGDAEPDDISHTPCNIWQGEFPKHNTGQDGYITTAPARSFEPNAYGLYNLVGNVWEWTSETYRVKSLKKSVKKRLAGMKGFKLSKGGSFLCHKDYCYRYRIAARTGTSPDSATPHQGFRVVWPQETSRVLA